jgi:hypothetical protein
MKTKITFGIVLLIQTISLRAFSQELLIKEMILQIDTLQYSLSANSILYKGTSYLAFKYDRDDEVCNVKIPITSFIKVKKIVLFESADYGIIDTVANINNKYYEFKVQFRNLSKTNFLKFRLNIIQ